MPVITEGTPPEWWWEPPEEDEEEHGLLDDSDPVEPWMDELLDWGKGKGK